jgi:hypothetical protein
MQMLNQFNNEKHTPWVEKEIKKKLYNCIGFTRKRKKNQIESHSSKVKTNNSNFYTFVPEEEEGPAAPADC